MTLQSFPYYVPKDISYWWKESNLPRSTYQSPTRVQDMGGNKIDRSSNTNWKVRVKQNADASNPYYREGWTYVKPGTGSAIATANGGGVTNGYSQNTSFVWSGMPPSLFVEQSDSLTADRALKKVKRSLAFLSTDKAIIAPVVELRELRSTIVQTLELTAKLIPALVDIKRTKGRSAFKYASEAWLYFGFGVSPLISDIKAISNSILAFQNRQDHTDRVTGTARKDWRSSYHTGGAICTSYSKFDSTVDMHHTLSYKYIAGYNFNSRSSNDYSLLDQLHVDLPSLIPAFWELVPYSWVVDYFTTVGSFLDDTFVADQGKCIYVVECKKYTVKAMSTFVHVPNNSNCNIVSGYCEPAMAEWYSFRRTPLSKFPDRKLRFKTMAEIGGLGAFNKVLNLAAVLAGRKL